MSNNNNCTLYIVRHGETEWNLKGIIQGHQDSALTPQGINQAKKLGKHLKDIKFDFAFSSDLLRTKKTAELISLEHNLTVQTSNLLRERYMGRMEGMEYAIAKKKFADHFSKLASMSLDQRFNHKPYQDIESDGEMITRFITILREISIGNPDKTGLIVTHGGIMRVFLMHLGWATPQELVSGAVGNTAYIKLESDGTDFFVKQTHGINKVKS